MTRLCVQGVSAPCSAWDVFETGQSHGHDSTAERPKSRTMFDVCSTGGTGVSLIDKSLVPYRQSVPALAQCATRRPVSTPGITVEVNAPSRCMQLFSISLLLPSQHEDGLKYSRACRRTILAWNSVLGQEALHHSGTRRDLHHRLQVAKTRSMKVDAVSSRRPLDHRPERCRGY